MKTPAALAFAIALSLSGSAQQTTIWDELTFGRLDPMAEAALNRAQQLSFQNDLEYCGYIAYDRGGVLRATRPKAGNKSKCNPDAPLGWEIVASYHTHGAVDVKNPNHSFELPSASDVRSDASEQIDGYLATPGGRLWFIQHSDLTVHQIGSAGSLMSDPYFRPSTCPPQHSYSIEELGLIERGSIGPCQITGDFVSSQ